MSRPAGFSDPATYMSLLIFERTTMSVMDMSSHQELASVGPESSRRARRTR
ncbi:hypothetical protein FM110_02700 [Brachybacterium nesterenkovii]|uniref:Uncharacterized protein n=1 Tax=Brachybacterium nesterenkovii TaxID=47847 RepID=A0A1X6WUL2_9MICO|nr:hypothetical protein FM110_02700 [Brachybacterium nesterenkovii]